MLSLPRCRALACFCRRTSPFRLPKPRSFLDDLPALVKPGGVAVLVSPYSWLKEYTPPSVRKIERRFTVPQRTECVGKAKRVDLSWGEGEEIRIRCPVFFRTFVFLTFACCSRRNWGSSMLPGRRHSPLPLIGTHSPSFFFIKSILYLEVSSCGTLCTWYDFFRSPLQVTMRACVSVFFTVLLE